MKYDFRKLGIKIIILGILLIIILNFLKVDLRWKLFLGSFILGSGLFLTGFGNFNPADHDDDNN